MRRVWGIYTLRQLTSPALRFCVIAGIAVVIVSSVSIKHVIENALQTSGPLGLARFSLSAVLDTSLFVQVMLVLAFSLIVWFAIDTVRTSSFLRQMRAGA
jgi:hypothetical protein